MQQRSNPRRLVALLGALVGAAIALSWLTPQPAPAIQNGRAPASALAPIHHPTPGVRVALAKPAAATWNTMRLCSVAGGVDLYPGGSRSAYRSYAEQVYFWQLYKSGRGNLAAYPGTSSHGLGRAVDLGLPRMRTYIDRVGRQHGWAKIEAPSEWWHVNHVGSRGRPDPGVSQRYPRLRRGSGGRCQAPAVREVQRRLGLRQDGAYGPATASAVKRFQRRTRGLHAHGVMTPKTWSRLRATSRRVAKGNVVRRSTATRRVMAGVDVRAAQGLLNARFAEIGRRDRVRVDGVFGAKTVAAVKRFQRLRGMKATGRIDERTWRQLRTPAREARPPDARPDLTLAVRWQSSRDGMAITNIVRHTTESHDAPPGPTDRQGLADLRGIGIDWNRRPRERAASAHVACDADGLLARYVPDSRRAFAASLANRYTLNIEIVGFASWPRSRWLARPKQLDCVAAQVAAWSRVHRIPIQEANVRADCTPTRRGMLDHSELAPCGAARRDPGAGFPRDVVNARAIALAGGKG